MQFILTSEKVPCKTVQKVAAENITFDSYVCHVPSREQGHLRHSRIFSNCSEYTCLYTSHPSRQVNFY